MGKSIVAELVTWFFKKQPCLCWSSGGHL